MIFARIIIAGFIFGFLSALPVGPSALEIVRRGICYGFRAAFFVALGTITSDIIYSILAFMGFSSLALNNPTIENVSAVIASIIIALLGAFIIYRAETQPNLPLDQCERKELPPYLTGLFMTVFNPFVFLFWASVIGLSMRSSLIDHNEVIGITFLISAIVGIFAWTIVLSLLSALGKINLNPKFRKGSNLAIGIFFIVAALVILLKSLILK